MREAVGIIGSEPKCGNSFLALDLAVAGQRRSPAKRGERRPRSGGVASIPLVGQRPRSPPSSPTSPFVAPSVYGNTAPVTNNGH
jgi:hypothetical protein